MEVEEEEEVTDMAEDLVGLTSNDISIFFSTHDLIKNDIIDSIRLHFFLHKYLQQ